MNHDYLLLIHWVIVWRDYWVEPPYAWVMLFLLLSHVNAVVRIEIYHHELTEKLTKKNNTNNKHKLNDVINESEEDNDDDVKYEDNDQPQFDLPAFRKLVSPITMKFQIDNYNVSGLDIRSLRCIDWTCTRDDGGSSNGLYTTYRPYRWVRRMTKSGSYVCRL